ncbi:MAG: hypothetical protein ACKOQZ_02565 [Actinomycetota bacterium]
MARRTIREEIDELERAGTLTAMQATSLRDAPQWSVDANELFAYLGGLIAAIGVTWLTIALFQDASPTSIAVGMLCAGIALGVGARFLHRPGSWRARLAEAIGVVAVGLLAGGIGILLAEAGMRSEHAASIVTGVCVVIGAVVARRTQFAGTIVLVVAAQVFVAAMIGTFKVEDELFAPALFVASGASILAAGTRRIGFALAARVAGTVSFVIGSFTIAVMQDRVWSSIVALALTLVLFIVSTRLLELEVIVGGAVGVTLTTSILVARVIDDQAVQGLAIVLIGIGMVLAASAVNKKRRKA